MIMEYQLVKFTKIDYIDSIVKGELWASFSSEFNDPFDAQMVLSNNFCLFDDILGENIDDYISNCFKISKYHPNYNTIIDTHTNLLKSQIFYSSQKEIFEKNFNTIKTILSSHQMICLSKCNPTLYEGLPMWAYYADSGSGLCITYALKSFNDFALKGILKEVIYEDCDVSTFTNRLHKKSLEEQNNTGKYIDEFLTTKHIQWKHGREYRVLVSSYKERVKNLVNPELFDYTIYDNKFDEDSAYKVTDLDRFIKMPVPVSIILGWRFDHKENCNVLASLKEYCKDNNIKPQELSCINSIPAIEEI